MASDSVPADLRTLAVIGDLVEDVVVWASDTRRGTDNPAAITRSRGGSAANVAVHAASLVDTRFIGRIGADPAGQVLTTELGERGVDARLQHSDTLPTGTVVVIVDPSGERTMYPARGAAAELGPVHAGWLHGVGVLHLPAYGLAEPSSRAVLTTAAAAVRHNGGIVSVDVSAASLVDQLGRAPFLELLDSLDAAIVFANADEATALGLHQSIPPGPLWVLKHGPDAAVARRADGDDVVVAPPTVLDAVDTTGAGDAFAAGFLASWLHGASVADALRSGHDTAATVVGSAGAG